MVQKWSFVVALSFFACLSEDAHAQFSLFRSSPAIEEITTTELKQLLSQRAGQVRWRCNQPSPHVQFKASSACRVQGDSLILGRNDGDLALKPAYNVRKKGVTE